MRDRRFIAVHRGGLLTIDHHRLLMWWARQCCLHVLPLVGREIDERLEQALQLAEAWEEGRAKVGAAMKAAVSAHAVARELSDPVAVAVARAVGQTVATAHMANHALGSALYGLKAVQLAGKSLDEERDWQDARLQQLPPAMVALVRPALLQKMKEGAVGSQKDNAGNSRKAT